MLSPGLLTHLVRDASGAARAGDAEAIEEAVRRLVERGDAMDLLAACRAWASTAVRALVALYEPPREGEMWALEDLGGAVASWRFSARLVTAHANRDEETVTALVLVMGRASQDEQHGSLRELLTYAARLEARAARTNRNRRGYGR